MELSQRQGQAQGRLRDLWDLQVPSAMKNSSLHGNTSPSLMSHLSPSPLHGGGNKNKAHLELLKASKPKNATALICQ